MPEELLELDELELEEVLDELLELEELLELDELLEEEPPSDTSPVAL